MPSSRTIQETRAQQRTQTSQEQDDIEVIRIDTDLIPIDVTVTNPEGETVRNLTQEDFKLYEDGVERPISFFGVERKVALYDLLPLCSRWTFQGV